MLDGEVFRLRPAKKTKATVGMMVGGNAGDDELTKSFVAPRAMLAWFEHALNPEHAKSKKHPGHGDESVEGCQACRLYDRLNDDDDPLELETVFEAANWAFGEAADRPTG